MSDVNRSANGRKRKLTDEQKRVAVGQLRISDLKKLFRYRYRGECFPDDDDGRHSLMIMLHHYARLSPQKVPRLIKTCTPWLGKDDTSEMLDDVSEHPKIWRANSLGLELNYTAAEWHELRLRTIAPVDMTAAERKLHNKLRKRQRMRVKRRIEEGRTPRAQYEANSKSRTKPWEAVGMCRSKWYKLQKEARGQVCAHKASTTRHTPVPRSKPKRFDANAPARS
jgi:hypothetical protein